MVSGLGKHHDFVLDVVINLIFDSCIFNSNSITLEVEKLQEISQIDEFFGLNKEGKTDSQDINWIEIHLKRAPKLVQILGKFSSIS